jgi:hypothetical protein
LVAGRKRVPNPAAGNTALRIFAIIAFDFSGLAAAGARMLDKPWRFHDHKTNGPDAIRIHGSVGGVGDHGRHRMRGRMPERLGNAIGTASLPSPLQSWRHIKIVSASQARRLGGRIVRIHRRIARTGRDRALFVFRLGASALRASDDDRNRSRPSCAPHLSGSCSSLRGFSN